MAAGVLLVRHGETAANSENRFLSRTDLPLSERGIEQVRAAGTLLSHRNLDVVFCSPMRRTIETAAILFPNQEIVIENKLCEIDFGEWEGLTTAEVRSRYPGKLEERSTSPVLFRPPGGESFRDVADRVKSLVDWFSRPNVTIVGHRGTLAVIERIIRKLPLSNNSIAGLETAEVRFVPLGRVR